MIVSRMASIALGGTLIVMACLIPPRAEAQNVARRVTAVRDGKVRMTFASREDICGFGNSISTLTSARSDNNRSNWNSDRSEDVIYDDECSAGPVRLVATIRDGQVNRIRAYVGGRWRPPTSDVTDIGAVSTKDAAEFLTGVANAQSGKAASEAIFATTLADSIDLVRILSPIAENESRPDEVRGSAIFWLGQMRSANTTEYLGSLYMRLHDNDVKEKVIFALSQRREGAAIDKLIEIAKNDPDRSLRKKAMFWLGQSKDPRVTAFLTDIITR